MYKCFYFKPAPDFKHDNIRLCYVTQDHHLYPILNEEAIEKIAKKANFSVIDLVEKIEYSEESDLIYYGHITDEMYENGNKDHVVILPENESIRDVLTKSIEKTNALIPYFKYDTNNKLSSFVHPTLRTLFTVNNDYIMRKNLLDKLYKEFPIDQFKFRNQTMTKISGQIF